MCKKSANINVEKIADLNTKLCHLLSNRNKVALHSKIGLLACAIAQSFGGICDNHGRNARSAEGCCELREKGSHIYSVCLIKLLLLNLNIRSIKRAQKGAQRKLAARWSLHREVRWGINPSNSCSAQLALPNGKVWARNKILSFYRTLLIFEISNLRCVRETLSAIFATNVNRLFVISISIHITIMCIYYGVYILNLIYFSLEINIINLIFFLLKPIFIKCYW